jgi:exosortase K
MKPEAGKGTWRAAALLVVGGGLLMLKQHYAHSSIEGLVFILSPTARLVTLLSGVRFDLESGIGYLSHDRLFAIAKPCAGVNFMVAAAALLGFVFSRRAFDLASTCVSVGATFAVSYAASVLVNAVRIAVAMRLAAHPLASEFWTAARVHRVLGIIVYFGGLAFLQAAAARATAPRRCSP